MGGSKTNGLSRKQRLLMRSRAMENMFTILRHERDNDELREEFLYMGTGRHTYTAKQKEYAFSLINTYGVRSTSRILGIQRRTIQRWCRRYGKQVRRCPYWVYDWVYRRKKRREFWQRRGY
jgi:hypothetical protein